MQKYNVLYPALLLSAALFALPATGGENKSSGGHTGSIGKLPIERDIDPDLPTLVFYVLPRCGICIQIDKWLVQLDQDNPAAANYVRKNSTDAAIQPEMNARGIKHHGLVFLDPSTNITWAAQAHGLRKEVLTAAFGKHLATKRADSPENVSTP